jgi:hypothetical protein
MGNGLGTGRALMWAMIEAIWDLLSLVAVDVRSVLALGPRLSFTVSFVAPGVTTALADFCERHQTVAITLNSRVPFGLVEAM